jgi:hypothetical protein
VGCAERLIADIACFTIALTTYIASAFAETLRDARAVCCFELTYLCLHAGRYVGASKSAANAYFD